MVKKAMLFLSLLNLELSFAQDVQVKPDAKNSFIWLSEKSVCYPGIEDLEKMITYDLDESGRFLEMTSVHWRGRAPCRGKEQFLMGKRWVVDIKNDEEAVLTLDDARIALSDESSIEYFNEKKFCGKTDWKSNEIVPCDGNNFIYHQNEIGFQKTINIKSKD